LEEWKINAWSFGILNDDAARCVCILSPYGTSKNRPCISVRAGCARSTSRTDILFSDFLVSSGAGAIYILGHKDEHKWTLGRFGQEKGAKENAIETVGQC